MIPLDLWSQYMENLDPSEVSFLTKTLAAICSTRKSCKISDSVRNKLADNLTRYPKSVVIAGCRTYLEKRCAEDGKDERYLFGIIRNEMKRGYSNSESRRPEQKNSLLSDPGKTEGQIAIERAMAEQDEARREQQWEDL